jgi:regulatory protein
MNDSLNEKHKQQILFDEYLKMQALCSVREYCSADILEKLDKRGVDSSDAAEILQMLKDNKFVDDARYAGAFTRDKSFLEGWGEKKILYRLHLKGIPDNVARSAMKEVDMEKYASKLDEVLNNKWKQLEKEGDQQKKRMKLFRFGMGRGYSYDEIKLYLDKLK